MHHHTITIIQENIATTTDLRKHAAWSIA